MSRTAFPGRQIPMVIDGPFSEYGGARPLTDAEILDADHASLEGEGDPAIWLVLKESDAKKLVEANEKGQAYEVIAILKSQPWWPELAAAARGLPHLRCSGSRVGCGS